MESGGKNSKAPMVVVGNQRKAVERIKIDNPFTFKVGQVFTGFGVGCGIGIGVGRPINLGMLPMVGQVMSATRGATDAFSGVSRHVNNSLRKIGAKNIEAGIGCGVGFGHGFGIGLALKPSALQQIQSCLALAVTKLTMKLGMAPDLSTNQGAPIQNPPGNVMQMPSQIHHQQFQRSAEQGNIATVSTYQKFASEPQAEMSFSRTEKVLSSFLHNNPLLKEDNSNVNEQVLSNATQLQSENTMLQTVLKHQQIIEELMQENEKLRQILVNDLKVPSSKLQTSYSSRSKSLCSECFECRRKQRRR